MSPHPRWERRIAALGKALAELGARRSKQRYLPPLSADELAEVEGRLGVALLDEHRAFLTRVARGEEPTGTAPLLAPLAGLAELPPGPARDLLADLTRMGNSLYLSLQRSATLGTPAPGWASFLVASMDALARCERARDAWNCCGSDGSCEATSLSISAGQHAWIVGAEPS